MTGVESFTVWSVSRAQAGHAPAASRVKAAGVIGMDNYEPFNAQLPAENQAATTQGAFRAVPLVVAAAGRALCEGLE